MHSLNHAAIKIRKVAGRADAYFASENFGMSGPGGTGLSFPLAHVFGSLGFGLLLLMAAVVAVAMTLFGEGGAFGALLATAPVAITQSDLKAVADKLGTAFEEFKAANDEKIKAGDRADALLTEKVEKANADISRLQAELSEGIKAAQRPSLNGPVSKDDQKRHTSIREFVALTRGITDPDQIEALAIGDAEIQAAKAYKSGMKNYLRSNDVRADMQVGRQADGGYLVSPDMSGRLVELIHEVSPIRQFATVETTTKDTYSGVYDLDEAEAEWAGEVDDRDDTDTPQLGEYEIPVREISALPKATLKMLEDSSRNIEAWLLEKAAKRFARSEGIASLTGDGLKRWRGILTYAETATKNTKDNWQKIQVIASGASGAFAASAPADKLIDMIHTLPSVYRRNAMFFGNTLTIAKMRQIKQDDKYVFQPDLVGGFAGTFFGYNCADFPDMPDLGASSLSLGFADLKEGYTVVDRLGSWILRDPYTKKGWVKFYVRRRSGGQVTNFAAIKLMKFANS